MPGVWRNLQVRGANGPVLTIVVYLARLIAEKLLRVEELRIEIQSEAHEAGFLVGSVDQAIATVVAHSLHRDPALNGAIRRRLACRDIDNEPVEVLHEVALTGAAETGRRRGEADSARRGRGYRSDLRSCFDGSDGSPSFSGRDRTYEEVA